MLAGAAAEHSNNFQKGGPRAERSVGKFVAAQVLPACAQRHRAQRSISADLIFGSFHQGKEHNPVVALTGIASYRNDAFIIVTQKSPLLM